MSRCLVLFFLLAGCAYGVESEINPTPIEEVQFQARPAPDAEPEMVPELYDSGDACVRQRFAADQIPYGFQLDINCPPDIYWPPRWIPPWDPGPIINAH